MAKNLNVNLAFSADTSKVKAELNNLKKSLNDLVNNSALKTPDFKFTKDLQEASKAAVQLKVQLEAATNVKTGNLDLTKFSESMNKSGMSLEKYQNQLYQLGPAGEKAFADLTRSITMAEVPLKRSSKLLDDLWVTMKNTARWQLTSSAMHGFMGAVQSAYGYAQNLNESLNNIRIVTGASVDKMAEFAQEANSAAKALSTTTTEYTNASLIFYQQGLSDSDVKERTDITIKMANAAGESAQKVSDQLTAVWNNFYDGSKSLEYYADVMTALGAATASSTDEIAGGLEKFAAVADTIGLSYEYAASALATITSNTRQSEEVVGTALKTIFARIQGLNLGETLDDGTTLNKYSEALAKVGISIYDSAGGLKDMDNILEEMASKWEQLSDTQQVALAQTVAGVRQYNQLVSLMDNWDAGDSDSMVANLSTSYGATGTLQEQADTYAESWEAANNRVRASAEAVYSAILNDEFFIDLANGFSTAIDGVKTFIDSLGGVKGVLLAIGSIITNVFSKQLSQVMQNAAFTIKGLFNPNAITQAENEQKKKANDLLQRGLKDTDTVSGKQSSQAYQELGKQQMAYIENAERMSQQELQITQLIMDRNRALADSAIKAGENLQKAQEQISIERKSLEHQIQIAAVKNKGATVDTQAVKSAQAEVEKLTKIFATLGATAAQVELIPNKNLPDEEFQKLKNNILETIQALGGIDSLNTEEDFRNLAQNLGFADDKIEEFTNNLMNLKNAGNLSDIRTALSGLEVSSLDSSAAAIDKLRQAMTSAGISADQADEMMKDYLAAIKDFGPKSVEASEALNKLKSGVASLTNDMKKAQVPPIALSEAFSRAASAAMAVGQAINTVRGIIDVFNDSEATTGDKILALISGFGMLVPAILSVTNALKAIPIASAGANGALAATAGTATTAGTAISLAMGQITLIVGAVVALIAAFVALGKAMHAASPEGKFEAATKAAEEAADAASKVNNEYKDLINTLDGLDSGIEKIKEMESGTLEWRQAIMESNNALIDLLSTYDMLSSENFTVDADGIMQITDEARKKLVEAQTEAMQAANTANYGAQVNKNNAEIRVDASDAAGEISLLRSSGDYAYDAVTDNSQLSADIGMAIGEALAQGRLNSDDLKDSSKLSSVLSEVSGLYDGEADAIAKQIAASDSLVSAFNELGISVAATTEANRILNNQIVDANFGDQIKASGLSDKGQENASNLMGSELEKRTQELYESTYKDKGALGGGMTDAEAQKKYAEAMGWATDTIENQNENKAKYYNKDGSEIGVISDEVARQFLAQQAAIEEMGGNVQDYISTVSNLITEGNKISDGFGEALSTFSGNQQGDLSSLNSSQLESVKSSITEIGNDGTFNIGDIKVDQAYAEKLGYETVQAYYDAIQNEIAATEESLDTDKLVDGMGVTAVVDGVEKTYNTAGDAFKKLFSTDGLDLDEMTAGSKKAFADAYKSIFDEGGAEALTAVDELVTKAGDSASEVAALIGETDWSDVDSADNFANKLQSLGITIDGVDIDNFIAQMKDAHNATKNFNLNEFKNEFVKINELAADINFGDIISEEDFNSLGEGFEDYFTLMADGSYKLTGDAEAFYNAVMEQSRDDLLDSIKTNISTNEENVDKYQSATSAMGENFNSGNIGAVQDDVSGAESQLSFIEAMGGANSDQLTAWNEALASDGEIAKEVFEEIALAAQNCATEYNNLGNTIAENDDIIRDSIQTYLSSAQSIDELETSANTLGAELGESVDNTEFYAEALINLGSQYENCSEEVKNYQKALASGDSATIKAAKDALTLSTRVGELSKKYDLNADVLETQVKLLKQNEKNAKLSEKQLVEMAAANQRMNKGIENLNKNWKTWSGTLKNSSKESMDYAEALTEMTDALVEITGALDASAIPIDFFDASTESGAEHLEWMARAAKGDVQAINLLGNAVGEATINAMTFNEQLAATAAQEGLFDTSGFENAQAAFDTYRSEVLEGITALQEAIKNGTLEAGQDVAGLMDGTGRSWVDSLNQMAAATGMSVSEMNSLLNQLGVQAEVEVKNIEQEMEVPTYTEVVEPGNTIRVAAGLNADGTTKYEEVTGIKRYTVPGPPQKVKGFAQVAQIKAEGNSSIGSPSVTWTGTGGSASGGGVSPSSTGGGKKGGGGGGKSKPAEKTKKSDIVKRYKEVEDKLDDIREEADKTRDSLDRLYGAEHEAAIQRLLELEQQEIDLLKEKQQEAKNYLREDLKELKKVSAEVDVEFKFDDKGNIKNYEEEMTELYEELAAIERKAGDEWDENEQKEIDALKEKIDKLEEVMDAYEETRELLEDINAELDAFKGKPALPLITSDTLDIYWEINDALDDIDEQIKDLERKAEGLSGEEKLKVLEEINRLEQERVAILQQQVEANQKDIEEKRAALDKLAELNGLQFEYDENGNIANYQEQIGILQAQLDELHAKKAADGFLSPAEEEAMNAIIAKMQELADLAGDYRDAVEESEDILNEIEDTLSGIAADPFVRSDFVDIFKETNDQLDDIDRKISKLQNEADKLTGEARRKKLNEIVTLERKRVEILEHQALIAKTEMEDRKRAMEEIAARQELMFEYDENQNITNYQEQLDILIDKYEKAYNEALGDDGLIDATEQAILDAISDDIDHLEEFIQAYCDAVEQLEDIEDEREEIANGGYVDMSQLDDIADELHDINQSLDDLQELLDDSSRAADRLYGAARIKQMEKNASLLQQEIDLLQQKKTAQDDIIAKEKQQLDEKTGGYIKYDEYGRITNYDSYINTREDQIREYEAALQEGGLSETEATLLQDEIDLLNEQIAAMEDYEQALEEKEDIQNQIEDAYYEWQDLNAEKLQYKLELQLDVNDRELAKIERAIKRLDGNFYSRAEALALMVGGGMNGDSKLGNYNKQLADLEAHYQEVKRQYEAGEISQAKYVEMTKELQAEIESTADAMAALQDQMDSYYKDTLAQARQELNFHISQLTHLTGILNHFKNTLTALGKSKDYEMMGTVLEGQVQALENEVKASKNAMQMWQKEADSIYQKYQQALSSGNQENADMYYNAYKEALSAANEAENKFYQQSAAWANALKALMENTLAGLAQDLENALTGGTSFDTITTQMKRASSLQEEYLTTTNKIYETTKLMRTAQQEIDKTTNSVAKQKLSQFITETKQMQSQNKLSKYELSIQQAKYDLLVAEIALEEARFAKSTVRLRRDSEGNFGYVYTADAEAIATAEQKFEDAQNKLYNIGLDGANKYTEKYQQTLAEMYNTLTSLQTKYLQGGFESEAEYNAAVLEAKEYYYEKLNQYSELYSVAINAESGTLTDTLVNNSGIVTDALTKNSRIAADAWSTDFADMTTKTDQWMVAVTGYLSQVQNAFADWEIESQRIANETVGTDLTTLKNKVSDIVTESDNLTAAIGDENNGVIKAIYDEITAVSGLVDQYASLNGQLTQAIQNALDLSDALQQDIDQAGQDENPPGQYAPGEEESQKPGTVVPEGTDPLPEIELPEDPDENNPTNPGETTPTQPGGTTPEGTAKCTHAETTTQEVAPKCEKGGYKKVLCDSCNKMLENVTYPALGHDYKEGKCTRCGKEDPNWKKSKDVLNNKVEGVAAAIWMDGSDVSGWGTGNTRKSRLKEKGVSEAQDYINKHAGNGDIYAAWHNKHSQLKQYYYGKFDTGGYTGAWGPEGKWAMLHEKEIVLNKEDTKNFLASLELLDNILSTIDLHAMNSQWTSGLISPDISDIGKEALEQMVNIEASFPNATDKQEIEEAFKDLVNLASQYANRK